MFKSMQSGHHGWMLPAASLRAPRNASREPKSASPIPSGHTFTTHDGISILEKVSAATLRPPRTVSTEPESASGTTNCAWIFGESCVGHTIAAYDGISISPKVPASLRPPRDVSPEPESASPSPRSVGANYTTKDGHSASQKGSAAISRAPRNVSNELQSASSTPKFVGGALTTNDVHPMTQKGSATTLRPPRDVSRELESATPIPSCVGHILTTSDANSTSQQASAATLRPPRNVSRETESASLIPKCVEHILTTSDGNSSSPKMMEEMVSALCNLEIRVTQQSAMLKTCLSDSFKEVASICSHVLLQCQSVESQVNHLEVSLGSRIQQQCENLGSQIKHLDRLMGARQELTVPRAVEVEGCSAEALEQSQGDTNSSFAAIPSLPSAHMPAWRVFLQSEFAALEVTLRGFMDKVELALLSVNDPSLHGNEIEHKLPEVGPLRVIAFDSEIATDVDGMSPCRERVSFPPSLPETPSLPVKGISYASNTSSKSPIRDTSISSMTNSMQHRFGMRSSLTDGPVKQMSQMSRTSTEKPFHVTTSPSQLSVGKFRTSKNTREPRTPRKTKRTSRSGKVSHFFYNAVGLQSHGENVGVDSSAYATGSIDMNFGNEGAFAALMFGTDNINVANAIAENQKKNIYMHDHWATKLYLNKRFKKLSLWVILCQAVYLGVAADVGGDSTLYASHLVFILFTNVFCAFFAFEWLIRFLAFEKKTSAIATASHVMDTLLVFVAITDTWIVEPLLLEYESSLPAVKPLHVAQVLYLCRLLRFVEAVPELKTLTRGIVMATQAVFWTVVMVASLTYMFGVVLHKMLKHEIDLNDRLGDRNFKTLLSSMWTLVMDAALLQEFGIQMTILLYSWSAQTSIACILLTFYMFIANLTILNMLIGVMNEVVCAIRDRERTESDIALMEDTILEHLVKFDDGDGLISKDELELVLADVDSYDVMRSLNVDRLFFLELQAMLFQSENDRITIARVVELMLLCRGDNVTTVRTLASGLLYIASLVHRLETNLQTATPRASV